MLVGVHERGVELEVFGAAGDGQHMALAEGIVAGEFLVPVGVIAVVLAEAAFDVFLRGEEVEVLAHAFDRELTRVVDLGLAFFGLLCCHEDHTGCGACAVDGSG